MKIIPSVKPRQVYILSDFFEIIHKHSYCILRFYIGIKKNDIHNFVDENKSYVTKKYLIGKKVNINFTFPQTEIFQEMEIVGETVDCNKVESDFKLIAEIIGDNGVLILR